MTQIQLPKLRKVDNSKPKKKKILLLADDLRMHSGIGTMSKEFVLGTVDKYDWVQLGAAVKHPEHGKQIDISAEVQKDTGVTDAFVKIYAHTGYGNQNVLKELLNIEQPDAILHFTDPRFWGWLYNMEHEIRQTMPLIYYNIWDDLPFPHWNEPFYESCDLLMAISKQTYNINKHVCQRKPRIEGTDLTYVPHGVDSEVFYPIGIEHAEFSELCNFRHELFKGQDPGFILFFNSRNIRRKNPGDLILSYKHFCDQLPKDKADKCALVIHSQISDEHGTDMLAVKEALCPDYKIIFSTGGISQEQLNFWYNLADVTVNIASNEGFGISWCESLHAGTPIINNVTGGLQDGCRFEDENGDWIKFTTDFPTNHDGTYKEHANWAKPVFPTNRSLQGSPVTPYIFDDRVDFRDVAIAIKEWYDMDKESRDACGMAGHDWVCGNESNMSARRMSDRFIECIEECLEKWTPRKRFTLYKVEQKKKIEKPGVIV